jgi:hypothetical protein
VTPDRPLTAALVHPVTLSAGALVMVNDFLLRGFLPGWLTGKLSDVGWLVVVPVLLGAGLGPFMRPRRAQGAALLATAAFYAVLQVWPPLGAFFKADHVADVGDLLCLPVLAVPVWIWRRPTRREPRVEGIASGAAAVALAGVLAADEWPPPDPATWPCGEDMVWPSGEPLRFELSDIWPGHFDTDAFLRGIVLEDEDGARLQVIAVVASDGEPPFALCAREGLRPLTAYRWVMGPWSDRQSNSLVSYDDPLPEVFFRTVGSSSAPVASAAECEALAGDLNARLFSACDPNPVGDTGESGLSPLDTGDSGADSGDSGADSGGDSGDSGDSGGDSGDSADSADGTR